MSANKDPNFGDAICGAARHEAIKRDPRKILALTSPARPQPLDNGHYLTQRHCNACGSTLVIASSDAALGL